MANVTLGGFRFRAERGKDAPVIIPMPVASAFGTAIFRGDVLKQVAGGGVEPAAAGDTNLIGISNGVVQYWDGTVVRPGSYLPASTTYGSNLSRQSIISVILFSRDTLLEVDADDGSTATTLAAFQAFYGENCDITATAGSTTTGWSGHCLDISTRVDTAAQFRIERVAPLPNQDYASSRVKLLVKPNESHLFTTAGI